MVAADDQRRRAGRMDSRRAALDHVERALDPDGRNVEVAVVDDAQPLEGMHLEEVAPGADERRLAANLARTEPRPRAIRSTTIVRRAGDGDVDVSQIA